MKSISHSTPEEDELASSSLHVTMDEELHDDSRFVTVKRMYAISAISFKINVPPLQRAYCYAAIFSAYLTAVTVFVEIFMNLDDTEYVMRVVRPAVGMINVMWPHFFISIRVMNIRKLFNIAKDFTWSELPQRDPESGSLTMTGWITFSQKYFGTGVLVLLTTHCGNLLYRIITDKGKGLFYDVWIPRGWDKGLGYIFMVTTQGLGSILMAYNALGIFTLYAVLVAVGCTQLQKLHLALMNIKQSENLSEAEMNKRLVICLEQHKIILEYMKELEHSFYLALLGPFILLALVLCFSAFSAIVFFDQYSDLIQVAQLVIVMMTQLVVFCWFGTELTTESAKVRDAVWSSDWVGAPISYQKSLYMIMLMSDEFVLTAGKIIHVSRETYMQVLKETYSYLMFLLSFAGGSNKE